jgi:HK97 family phage prohead protease
MEHFYAPFEFKMDGYGDEEGSIQGYGSTFGNVDSYGDTVAKGAFRKTIADAKSGAANWPAMLSQHGGTDQTPIGIWTDMNEDDRGLKLKGKLAINTKRGAETYALLKMKPRPALNGLSIGYRAIDIELHRRGPVKRTLKAVDLVECSLVTFPADKFARVASVKSWADDEPVDEAALAKAWAAMEWQHMSRLAMRKGR